MSIEIPGKTWVAILVALIIGICSIIATIIENPDILNPNGNVVQTQVALAITQTAMINIQNRATDTPTSTLSQPTIPPSTPSATTVSPPSPNSRISYTRYYSDLYLSNGWDAVWSSLLAQGTVAGSPPAQRGMICSGQGYSQQDDYSCASAYGVETFMLDAESEVTIHDPHCIAYDPGSSSLATLIRLPDARIAEGLNGVTELTTNVRVSGQFTLFIWCVANWQQ